MHFYLLSPLRGLSKRKMTSARSWLPGAYADRLFFFTPPRGLYTHRSIHPLGCAGITHLSTPSLHYEQEVEACENVGYEPQHKCPLMPDRHTVTQPVEVRAVKVPYLMRGCNSHSKRWIH